MTVTNDTLKLIGKTPVYRIGDTNVYVKLEKYNVGGSVKDRTVLGMLEAAEAAGKITNETIIVEASSGNTGITLAALAAIKGLKAVVVMPESMSKERRELIKAYGAQLVLTPKELGMKGALAKADEIIAANPGAITLGQFDNPANPDYHYRTTGAEILEQVPNVGVFVAGIGTGGTFTGVVRRLRETAPDLVAVAVEPAGSPVISEGRTGTHVIQGIGAGFIPANFDKELMNRVETVADEVAKGEVKTFMAETGIGIGISAGAAIATAKKLAAEYPDKAIVAIAPDGVEKYLSMIEFDSAEYVKA